MWNIKNFGNWELLKKIKIKYLFKYLSNWCDKTYIFNAGCSSINFYFLISAREIKSSINNFYIIKIYIFL